MIEEIPWTVISISSSDLDKVNDKGSEGWQPFAVWDNKVWLRRVGTTTNRVKIPVQCGTCVHFKPVGRRKDQEAAFGHCMLRKHSTNELHYCNEYESLYVNATE